MYLTVKRDRTMKTTNHKNKLGDSITYNKEHSLCILVSDQMFHK